MNIRIKRIIFLILILIVIYLVLGWIGFVPLYHCDSAMGANGPIHWCEWYPGGQRIY